MFEEDSLPPAPQVFPPPTFLFCLCAVVAPSSVPETLVLAPRLPCRWMLSFLVAQQRGWGHDEHQRFLEALEKYGDGNTGNEWHYMAEYVGGRTANEIKLHAHKYFIKLQAATTKTNQVMPAMKKLDDRNWTKREELVFENALATHDECESSSESSPGSSIGERFTVLCTRVLALPFFAPGCCR